MWRDDATLLDINAGRSLGPAVSGRDRLLHGYDNVDLDLVWKTVDEDLPALVTRLEGLAPRQDS